MRKMFAYPPLLMVVFLIVGILIGEKLRPYFNELIWCLISGGSTLLVIFVFKRFQPISRYVEFVIFAAIIMLIGSSMYVFTDVRTSNDYIGKLISKADSKTLSLEIRESLKSNSNFNRYVAEIKQVQSRSSSGKVIVNVKKDSIFKLEVGSRFITQVPLNEITSPKNPFEFNYAKYLKYQQIFHQLFVSNGDMLILKEKSDSFLVQLEGYREALIAKIAEKGIKNNELGVISALLLGERDYLSGELRASYIDAGAIHILAISGLHIGILFLILGFLFKPLHSLPYGKLFAQISVMVCLWLFAMLAGLSASVVRAVTMFSFISIGLFLNRKNSIYHSLIASAFVLFIVHPRFLFDVGFQLSYTAVFFIVWLQPKFERLWKPKYKIIQYFWQLLTVSAAAQLGVLPLSLFYFHQFPSLFFISNIFIIPMLGILLGFGIFVLFLVQFQVSADVIIQSYASVVEFLNRFIEFLAGYESFVIRNIFWSSGLLITAYLLLITFFKYAEKKASYFRFGIAVVAVFSFYSYLFYETTQQKKQHELVIFHRSRATFIGQLTGQKLKVLGGSDANSSAFIENYVASKGIKKINYSYEIPDLIVTNTNKMVVIDSLGLFEYTSIKNPIVLLRNSPKINVDRMIQKLHPTLIIADGSNYRSFVQKWEESALKTKTPFHDTSQKGAFILN